MILGFLIISAALPCTWLNERRAAKLHGTVALARGECRTVNPNNTDEASCGFLVHVKGAEAQAQKTISDIRFPAVCLTGTLRLRSEVQAYQWVERAGKADKGSETPQCIYEKEWKSFRINESCFNENRSAEIQNKLILQGLRLGVDEQTCSLVHLGERFLVPPDLVRDLTNFEDASGTLGQIIEYCPQGSLEPVEFVYDGGCYYFPKAAASRPEVGDMRVTFAFIPECPLTIMALQARQELQDDDDEDERFSLLPYRIVYRGFCGISEDERKELLIKEGKKSLDEIADEDAQCCSFVNCLCCCSICIFQFFTPMTPMQVYHVFPEAADLRRCWQSISVEPSITKWVFRLVGWAMTFVGCRFLFIPFLAQRETFGRHVPAGAMCFTISCLVLATLHSLIIAAIAHVLYRPFMTLAHLTLIAGIVLAILVLQTS